MKKLIKKYKERIELYEGFIKKGKVYIASKPEYYQLKIDNIKEIIERLETDTLTPEFFDSLSTQDKWELSHYLDDKVDWFCVSCGNPQEVSSPHFGSLHCGYCDSELSRRTGGGMHNPFNWKFKWNLKAVRKQKLNKIIKK